MKRLKELDTRHKAACRLRIEGRSNDDIAAQLNVAKRTLAIWFSDELVKEYLQELAENVEQEFAVQLAQGGMKAISALTGMLEKQDREPDISDTMKMEAARELLDRLPGTTKTRERRPPEVPPGGDTNNLMAVFANMPNDQLAGFLNGGWKEMLDGSDNGSQGVPPGLPAADS